MKKIDSFGKRRLLPLSFPWFRFSPWGQWFLWFIGVGLLGMGLAGCVQRRLTIRTDPPGAMAYVDGYPIGTTPVSTDFIYYGTREIRLIKDGYETVVVKQRIGPPWYEIPPLDFISENLVPGELRDHRTLDFRLQPQRVTPSEQLVDRAERLRRGEVFQPSAGAVGPGVLTPPPRSAAVGPTWLTPPGAVGSGHPGAVPESEIGGRTVYPLPPSGSGISP